jgi:hypothetical protein
MSSLSDIDPKRPVTPDIIAAVNTLELVAVCLEAEVLDRQVVMRTFREQYTRLYRRILACKALPGLTDEKTGKPSGEDLLNENPAAQKLYRELEMERLNAGMPPKLQN